MSKKTYLIYIIPLIILFQNCGGSFESFSVEPNNNPIVNEDSSTSIIEDNTQDPTPEMIENSGPSEMTVEEKEAALLMKSLISYENSLYKTLTENTCNFCHINNKYPFIGNDSLESHNFLIDKNLVDLKNANNSLIYRKAAAGHQGTQAPLADEILKQINTWISVRDQ